MNKTTKVIIGGAILIGAIILFSYFQTRQSVFGIAFDYIGVSGSQTAEGGIFNLDGVMYGSTGNLRFSNIENHTIVFNGNPNKQPSGFPSFAGIDGQFPFSKEWYPQPDATFSITWMMWKQTPPSGDWQKDIGSSTSKGNVECRAVGAGRVVVPHVGPTGYYTNIECKIIAEFNCGIGSNCEIRGFTGGNIHNILIPKVGFEKMLVYRLESNVCNQYNIYKKDKISTDYSESECNSKIISYIDIYRLENNLCVKYTIDSKLKTEKDYTQSECNSKIISYIDVYRLENNTCVKYNIDSKLKTENDYTLEICNSKIETEPPVIEPVIIPVECTDNEDCISICGDKIPTCENNACFCSGKPVFEEEPTPYYIYLIPVLFGLVALIVWMKLKKPRRKKS